MDIQKTMEFILEQQAHLTAQQAASAERHDREMAEIRRGGARTDRRLDRAVRLAVREARAERRRRQELDEKITQLAAAQRATEESLRAFIDSLRRGGNGNHPA